MAKRFDIEAFLRQVVEKQTFSATDKAQIVEIANTYGVQVRQTRCGDCWRDTAVQCYCAVVEQKAKTSKRKYIMRGNVDVIWEGVRVNSATITDEKAREYIANGMPTRWFVKIDGKMQ